MDDLGLQRKKKILAHLRSIEQELGGILKIVDLPEVRIQLAQLRVQIQEISNVK